MYFRVYKKDKLINSGCFNNAEELLNGVLSRYSTIVRGIEKKRLERKYGRLTVDNIVNHYKQSIRIETE